MSDWNVTWWDGGALRVTFVPMCDAFSVASVAGNMGVITYSILKIERVARS